MIIILKLLSTVFAMVRVCQFWYELTVVRVNWLTNKNSLKCIYRFVTSYLLSVNLTHENEKKQKQQIIHVKTLFLQVYYR